MKFSNTEIFILVLIGIIALWFVFMYRSDENLCVKTSYGIVSDVPASTYVDAPFGLTDRSSLGQKPLGDPRFWIPQTSPITQGQYGLYQPNTIPLDETQPFNMQSIAPYYAQGAVYTGY